MPVVKIGQLLGSSDALRAVTARTRRLRALQTAYEAAVPQSLAAVSRVKSLRAGTLYIAAESAAAAAKLRQIAPRTVAGIAQREPEVTQLSISVQVGGRAKPAARRSEKRPVPGAALQALEALSTRVADENLKGALTRLVQRHRRRRTGPQST